MLSQKASLSSLCFDVQLNMNVYMNMIEIETISGNRFLIDNDWSKVYNLVEKTRYVMKLQTKFPFIVFKKHTFCDFKFKTVYNTLRSCFDKRIKANCNILQLASLFDVNVKCFDESCTNHDMHTN